MGETAKNACGVNANQANMAGTGIGTFNDRIRDGVRGGSPFDNGEALVKTPASCTPYTVCAGQGFATGLWTDPNELNVQNAQSLGILLANTDWIKSGMAGGLKDFVLVNSQGTTITRRGDRVQRRRHRVHAGPPGVDQLRLGPRQPDALGHLPAEARQDGHHRQPGADARRRARHRPPRTGRALHPPR